MPSQVMSPTLSQRAKANIYLCPMAVILKVLILGINCRFKWAASSLNNIFIGIEYLNAYQCADGYMMIKVN